MDSSDEDDLMFVAASIAYLERPTSKKKPRFWMRDFLKKRETHGACCLRDELLIQDAQGYKNFLRLSPEDFEILLQKVAPMIKKNDTNFRMSIPPSDQLIVTLRYLATGDSYASLMYLSRISKTTVSICIPEVCTAIVQVLAEYVKMPTSADEWKTISKDFEDRWNFPQCIGALDGKHVEIIKPVNSGSEYFNYKKSFSIVLLALVDANYNFIYVDVGVQGRLSDGGVFNSTNFYNLLTNNNLLLPPPQPLPGRQQNSPYVIVADDAFALNKHVLKPYPGTQITGSPQRIFNYRLSRARVVVENAFGIISARFRVLRQPILLSPAKASLVTLACVYLHNFVRRNNRSSNVYAPVGTFDTFDVESGAMTPGTWRNNNPGLLSLQRIPRRDRIEAVAVRNEFKDYFMTDTGSVQWQNQYA